MHDGFIYVGFGGLALYIFCDIVGGWLDSRERKRKKLPDDEKNLKPLCSFAKKSSRGSLEDFLAY